MNQTNKESVILSQVYSDLVVELQGRDTPVAKALEAIVKVTKDFDKIPDPRRILKILIRDYKDIIIKDDVLCFIIGSDDESNDKGGETVKKNYNNRNTSGENKIAFAILKECDFEAVPSVSKEAFEKYLEVILPSINKRVKPNLALKVMLRGAFLTEEDGNISLGEKGKELLSQ